MNVAALIIAVLALLFTVGSFWWLNARRGKLQVARPPAYAFARKVRLRLPLTFYITGAKALIVADLRVVIDGEAKRAMPWITTRSTLRPEGSDGFAFGHTRWDEIGRLKSWRRRKRRPYACMGRTRARSRCMRACGGRSASRRRRLDHVSHAGNREDVP